MSSEHQSGNWGNEPVRRQDNNSEYENNTGAGQGPHDAQQQNAEERGTEQRNAEGAAEGAASDAKGYGAEGAGAEGTGSYEASAAEGSGASYSHEGGPWSGTPVDEAATHSWGSNSSGWGNGTDGQAGYPYSGEPHPGQMGYAHPGYPGESGESGYPGQGPSSPFAAGQPGVQMQAPPKKKEKRRFSTPAVAALVLAAAVASGVITGSVVGSASNTSSSDNSSALQALNSEPAKTVNKKTDGSVQDVAQKVLPSVVSITVVSGRSGDTGSGSILSEDGTIITNNHVIESAANGGSIKVTLNNGSSYDADIVARDPESDIAVIKAKGASGLTPISLGDSDSLAVGQEVVAIGSPLGLDATVTSGIISAQNRPVQVSSENSDQSTLIDAIQTDAAINPGNSGGALVDMDGNLIGIPSVIASLGSSAGGGESSQGGSIGLGFAIPINQARNIAEQLIKDGSAKHPAIGITINTNSSQRGAEIVDVPSGSDAEKAGLKAGDVVVKVDDRSVDSGISLIAAIRSHQVGDTVKLEVTDKDGKNSHEVTMTLTAQESVKR